MSADDSSTPLTSPKGQERAARLRARIVILMGYRGWQPKAEASALRWILARLEHVERRLDAQAKGAILRVVAGQLADALGGEAPGNADIPASLDLLVARLAAKSSPAKISQAQAVAILRAWTDRGSRTTMDGDPVLDGLVLEGLGIR